MAIKDGASLISRLLFEEATDINFYVGKAVNPAHQNPDLLYEPEEIAEAFDELERNGKVRYFGVSNVPTMMLEVLKKYVRQPLVFN